MSYWKKVGAYAFERSYSGFEAVALVAMSVVLVHIAESVYAGNYGAAASAVIAFLVMAFITHWVQMLGYWKFLRGADLMAWGWLVASCRAMTRAISGLSKDDYENATLQVQIAGECLAKYVETKGDER